MVGTNRGFVTSAEMRRRGRLWPAGPRRASCVRSHRVGHVGELSRGGGTGGHLRVLGETAGKVARRPILGHSGEDDRRAQNAPFTNSHDGWSYLTALKSCTS